MIALSTPLELVSFISVDVETTGLDPRRDAIIEIGAVKVRGGAVVDEFATFVATDRTIPYAARRVNNISNEMLVGAPRVDVALSRLWSFAGDGALVEHSHKAFDVAFLETAHGLALTYPYINTCTLSRKLFPFHRSHSLEECCKRLKIVNTQQHRALSDARATAHLLIKMLEVCSMRYPRLEDLITVASVQR
ncbi:MAG TPA: exonuclease domain-containing protein [Chloroflexota bacterium]